MPSIRKLQGNSVEPDQLFRKSISGFNKMRVKMLNINSTYLFQCFNYKIIKIEKIDAYVYYVTG